MVARTDERDPAMLVYPADFYADEAVRLMTLEQEGAYWRLLMHAHREGSIPNNINALCAIVAKVPARRFPAVWAAIACKWQPHPSLPDRLVNPRQERERAKRAETKRRQSEGGRVGNAKRWHRSPTDDRPTDSASVTDRSHIKSLSERVSERGSACAREEPAAEPRSERPRRVTLAALEARRGPPGLEPPTADQVAAMQRELDRQRVYPMSPRMRAELARALAAEREHPDNLGCYAAELGGKTAAQRGARLCALLTDPERLQDANARMCREAHEETR